MHDRGEGGRSSGFQILFLPLLAVLGGQGFGGEREARWESVMDGRGV
jgi:hypothetical protein